MRKALKAAFPLTIPVMLGYLFVGIAFGLLLHQIGYSFIWAFLMSGVIYAGSMQFVAINLLKGSYGLIEVALITFFVNIRHIFYGLSFIDKFKVMGKKKLYMMFSLTDETYSLLCSSKAPEGVDKNLFLFCISILNQIYWIMGSIIGTLVGTMITFNTTGIDFAMTALFTVIFLEQWFSYDTHTPALIGVFCTILALLIFGRNNLILPSMLFMALTLILLRRKIEDKVDIMEGDESK